MMTKGFITLMFIAASLSIGILAFLCVNASTGWIPIENKMGTGFALLALVMAFTPLLLKSAAESVRQRKIVIV